MWLVFSSNGLIARHTSKGNCSIQIEQEYQLARKTTNESDSRRLPCRNAEHSRQECRFDSNRPPHIGLQVAVVVAR